MRKLTSLFILCFLMSFGKTVAQGKDSTKKEEKSSSYTEEYNKFRFGGYGEMVASYMDYGLNRMTENGSVKENRGTVAIPRFVLAFDYKFSPTWILGAEIEFEYGGTGSAREIEWYEENGEYEVEIEKGGEVALEQFHITKLIHPAFNIRAGHMIVPVGLTNSHHEPVNFFGVYRPEGETTILPSTWHETGIAFFGKVYKFDYELQLVAGLDPQNFRNTNWVGKGRQGAFEIDNFTSPAFVARLNYSGIRGLRIGGSFYYNQTAKNSSKPTRNIGHKFPVTIFTADAQYKSPKNTFIARANMVYGNLGEAASLSEINRKSPKTTGYPTTDVAKNAVSYAGEAGYNVGSFFGEKAPRIYPFVRYEYYNPMEKAGYLKTPDARLKTSMWTVGLNYYALPNLVVKADYSKRRIGGGKYNNENITSIGIAYVGWFVKR